MQLTADKISAPQFSRLVLTYLWLFSWAIATVVVSQESGETDNTSEESYCSRTSDPDLSQRLRLEAIKHEILLRLGLDEAPPNPDPSIEQPTADPTYMENYRAAQEVQKAHNANQRPCTELDTHKRRLLAFFPSSMKGYRPIEHPAQSPMDKNGNTIHTGTSTKENFYERYRLKFDVDLAEVTSITNIVEDLKAELRLFKVPRVDNWWARETPEDRVEIRLIQRPEHYLNQELLIFITHQLLEPTDGYAVFNVTKAVMEWVSRNNGLSGELEIDVLIRSPEAVRYGPMFEPKIQFSVDTQTTQLVLTVYDDEGSNRRKRFIITPEYAVNNKIKCEFRCCWRPLVVNFRRDYNWTWITEPESVEFNYCSGECPEEWAVEKQHTRLLDRHRQRILDDNPTGSPKPCCVPDSYKKEFFVLNIRNKTEFLWIDDAIVTSCVCR